jgi:hypothetical protein
MISRVLPAMVFVTRHHAVPEIHSASAEVSPSELIVAEGKCEISCVQS